MLTLSPADLERELDAVAATGASWLRVLFDWNLIEPSKGQYQWAVVDRIVDAAAARDLRVLGNIAFTPGWARGPQSFFTAPPDNPDDFGAFATAVVEHFGSRVSDWEIWNEPNLPLFWGFQGNAAPRYTELLKAAYVAIKDAQPSSTVVSAGLSRAVGGHSPPSFMTQMYAAGAKGYFDAAAMHPYVFPGGLAVDPENGWSDVGRVREVMVANGDGGKKIWMTEFGAPTSDPGAEGVSQQQQARQITDILWAASELPYSGPAFIYSIRDLDSGARGNREANFGALLTSDWQPKVAASVLAR
ncbi:MAG: cellulase family glycosylhydrolase [Actinomycetota bacterium]|nr:cellulase family glycosylhydrolase [Actinomycetota bacterium]